MATSGSNTTTYVPMSVLTGTTLLPTKTTTAPKPVVVVSQPTQGGGLTTVAPKPVVISQPTQGGGLMSGSPSTASTKTTTTSQPTQGGGYTSTSPSTTSTKTATTSQPTDKQKQAIRSLSGIDAAAAKMPTQSKAQIANAFMQAMAAAATQGKAVPNPAGLTSDEADKYRSQFYTAFYSGKPVPQIVDNTALPSPAFNPMFPALTPGAQQRMPLPDLGSPLYQVNQFGGTGLTPALGVTGVQPGMNTPYMGVEFEGYQPNPLGMGVPGTNLGTPDLRALSAAMSPRPIVPATIPYGRGTNTVGMPNLQYVAPGGQTITRDPTQAVRPGVPAGMPAAPFIPQAVRPGTPAGLPAALPPAAPAGGGYDTDMLNSKGIARYLLQDMMGKQQSAAPTITAQQQAAPAAAPGFNPLSLLIGEAKGAELPANYGAAPTTRTVPVMSYTGKPSPSDVLLSQLATGIGLGSDKARLTLANPFYQEGRVGASNPLLGDVLTTPSAYDVPPFIAPTAPGGTTRTVTGTPMVIPSRLDEEAMARERQTVIPASLQDPSGQGRLVTDPVTGITQEAGSTQTAGYDPLLSYDLVQLFKQGTGTPGAAPIPQEKSTYLKAYTNPTWAQKRIEEMDASGESVGTQEYADLYAGFTNSPNRTADQMTQADKLRLGEQAMADQNIPLSGEYGGPNDMTDQKLDAYKTYVEPNLPKGGGTAGAIFTPPPGTFVGTNGYVYEPQSDGSFKHVGKVPGYTDAQLYEAANAGAFRNQQSIPVGPKKAAPKKTTTKKASAPKAADEGSGNFFDWLFKAGDDYKAWRKGNREAVRDFLTGNKKADGGMIKGYRSGGSTNTDHHDGGGSSTTTSTTTYTPPTQAQIDALYAPYFQPAVTPPSTYVPGISGEFNYFPTPAPVPGKPVTPVSPTIINKSASDWFNQYMNAKTRAEREAARKAIASGDTTYHSLFDTYRDTLGHRTQPSLQGWLDWYGKQTFAQGGQVQDARLVLGAGGPKADKIPANIDGVQEARLSNGEFVMTAAAVKNAGGGDPVKGAERLMQLNEMLSYGRPAEKLNVQHVKGKAR